MGVRFGQQLIYTAPRRPGKQKGWRSGEGTFMLQATSHGEDFPGYVAFEYDVTGSPLGRFQLINVTSRVHALAIDQTQCVLMTGQIPTPVFSYATMKFGTNGSLLWTSFYPSTSERQAWQMLLQLTRLIVPTSPGTPPAPIPATTSSP